MSDTDETVAVFVRRAPGPNTVLPVASHGLTPASALVRVMRAMPARTQPFEVNTKCA